MERQLRPIDRHTHGNRECDSDCLAYRFTAIESEPDDNPRPATNYYAIPYPDDTDNFGYPVKYGYTNAELDRIAIRNTIADARRRAQSNSHTHEHTHERADKHAVAILSGHDYGTCNPLTTCIDDSCTHCHEHLFGTHHRIRPGLPPSELARNRWEALETMQRNPDDEFQARQEYVDAQKRIMERTARDITARMVGDELRIKNAATGGEKNMKDSQLSAAPAEAMIALGRVYGFGARKYARHNFRKGYAWSLSYDAMQRHIEASLAGEDYDPESGLPHLAHVAWHALTLTQFLIDKRMGRHPAELDDRYVV